MPFEILGRRLAGPDGSGPAVPFAAAAAAFVEDALVGVVALDRDARILWANGLARQILAADGGLTQRRGRLSVRRVATGDAANLDDLLAGAIEGKRGCSTVVGTRAPQRPLTVYANPVLSTEADRGPAAAQEAVVVVLIVDPWLRPSVSPEQLELSLGLSPAESLVVARLAAGESVAEIAHETRRTENAVRWLVKQALTRTGCRRQADLVRLALMASRLPVPEPGGGESG